MTYYFRSHWPSSAAFSYKTCSSVTDYPFSIRHLSTMRNLTFFSFFLSFFLCIFGKNVYRPQQDPFIAPLDATKVPGQSPLYLCSLTPGEDLIDIKYINITPNPPQAGKNLTIDAMGVLKIEIDEGAYVNFEVKYGVIKLVAGTADICEKALEVELECPLKQGEIKVHKTVELPSHIPPVCCLSRFCG